MNNLLFDFTVDKATNIKTNKQKHIYHHIN